MHEKEKRGGEKQKKGLKERRQGDARSWRKILLRPMYVHGKEELPRQTKGFEAGFTGSNQSDPWFQRLSLEASKQPIDHVGDEKEFGVSPVPKVLLVIDLDTAGLCNTGVLCQGAFHAHTEDVSPYFASETHPSQKTSSSQQFPREPARPMETLSHC